MRLFKPDCFAIITTEDVRLDLSPVSEKTDRRLDMSFNCFLSETSEPNTGECTIYNLSETSRNFIQKGSKIEVFAGYDGAYKLISIGDVEYVNNRKPATDWATTISWGDGIRAYLDTNFSKSYKEGVNIKEILNDLSSSFGLSIDVSEIKTAINGGLSISGKTKDILNKLTNDYGLTWSIQDEVVRVIDEGKPVDEEVIFISQDTGLLEFPQISEKGIDFVAQLNPDLRPNKLVNIKSLESVTIATTDPLAKKLSSDANGINIVQTVRFVGDNFGGQFSAMCNCVSYDG